MMIIIGKQKTNRQAYTKHLENKMRNTYDRAVLISVTTLMAVVVIYSYLLPLPML
jgi:preprotein translocase subunit SecF